MKKVYLDTNILVDIVADRQPFSKFAIEIFQQAEKGNIHLFANSHSIATMHYLLKKYLPEKDLREVILELLDFLTIIPVDVDTLKKGLKSQQKDFEDALQTVCASTIERLDCIITRNGKDFKNCGFKVLSPDEFCLTL